MLDGLKKYIEQEIKDPEYSEVYWTQSVAGVILKAWPLSFKVKGIYTNSIFISYEGGAAIQIVDILGRQIFQTHAGADGHSLLAPFWYYFPGNRIGLTAVPGANINFSISYQLITEHKLNRGGQ